MTVLWKRLAERYVVEIHVGDVWVVHASHDTVSAAEADARAIVSDNSVREARVCAMKTAQSYAVVSEIAKPISAATPKDFTPTGALVQCRACQAKGQRVVRDGAHEWVFCTACKRAYPC